MLRNIQVQGQKGGQISVWTGTFKSPRMATLGRGHIALAESAGYSAQMIVPVIVINQLATEANKKGLQYTS